MSVTFSDGTARLRATMVFGDDAVLLRAGATAAESLAVVTPKVNLAAAGGAAVSMRFYTDGRLDLLAVRRYRR